MKPGKQTIWHPFTQMLNCTPALEVTRGNGVYLELKDGRQIVDCISSWWVNIHGHANPEIANAIYEQAQRLEQVIFAGFTHEPAKQISDLLLTKLPENLVHVFFSDNGSTAVEVALKMSYQYWHNLASPRNKFIAFKGGYHGDTVGAMSIGSGSPFWEKFSPLMFSPDLLDFPSTYEDDESVEEKEKKSLSQAEVLLKANAGEYAAICLEPLVQGAAGMRMCRAEFLQQLAALARQHGLLLIFDEVMTGFGRTGDFFACNKSGVKPDIICLSKGITGGFLPLSVTVCSSEIYETFLDEKSQRTFYHGHSYTANPIACAAAVASFELLERNQNQFKSMESLHRNLAATYLNKSSRLKNKRYCGTIFAADVQTNGQDDYFNEIGPLLKKSFLERGFLIRPLGNTIYLMPPYCISEDVLESAYACIAELTSRQC